MLNKDGAPTFEARPSAKRVGRLYDLVGGDEGVRDLVETFYDIVEHEPEARVLHILHLRGHGIAHSRTEQFEFLSGFLGGPDLYADRIERPDVRKMHAHVEIDHEARDAWLNCMSMAIDRVGLNADVKQKLMGSFTRVAMLLRNKD